MGGEVEIVRKNLSKVFFNTDIGVVDINEDKVQGRMIISNVIKEKEKTSKFTTAASRYIGSDL